ncbi:hypothetical protein PV325_009807, partial [Microctonus aethiopoides]
MNFSFECLDEPVTTKISSNKSGNNVAVGTCMMQGWRKSLQDAYNICIDYDDDVSYFALYDGHGGHEVATYCAKELPEFIKQTYAYSKGNMTQALISGVSEFDITLTKPEVVEILNKLSQVDISKKPDEDEHDVEVDCNNESEDENKVISNIIPEKESKNDDFNTATKDNEVDKKKSNNPDSNNANQNCAAENVESPQECIATGPEKNLESSKPTDILNSEKVEDRTSSNEIEFIGECSEKSAEINNFESNEELIVYDEDDSDYDDY